MCQPREDVVQWSTEAAFRLEKDVAAPEPQRQQPPPSPHLGPAVPNFADVPEFELPPHFDVDSTSCIQPVGEDALKENFVRRVAPESRHAADFVQQRSAVLELLVMMQNRVC
eukprot:TRINITY_DN10699_c0_g3_i4.p1 TRINITY_DN10699_c0_g3~~TRINITY_DN10699_c0_g3_i4.p1  ORF type:complete len:112 (+),score=24.67 TRINITY_DN10699_c0_g3_i4:85-420(+)